MKIHKTSVKRRESQKAYRLRNLEKRREATRAWRRNNPTARRDYYNKNKERILQVTGLYRKNNSGRVNSWTRTRQAAKLLRTPKWLTSEHLKQIEQFYIDAKDLQWLSDPTDILTVDHIIPLQGKIVSGLHVPWNLQILPMSMNSSKGTRYET